MPDRRVQYTKMVIRDSFIALLGEKPLDKITVTEICRKADINRATFYAHYSDPADLLSQLEAEIAQDITACTINHPQGGIAGGSGENLIRLFEYFQRNKTLCRVLIKENRSASFQPTIRQLLQNNFVESLCAVHSFSRRDAEYLYAFAAGGCMGALWKWIEEDMTESAAELFEILLKLLKNGFADL